MDLPIFFSSSLGSWIVQSFFHSLVAAAVVEIAVRAWDIVNPAVRQRFHLLAVAFPVFSFPLFQAMSPDRGSVQFRMRALFDSGRWLYLELPGRLYAGGVLLAVLLLVTLIFLLQELVPIARNVLASRRSDPGGVSHGDNPKVIRALGELPAEKPDIYILEEDDLVIFSSTGKHASIFLSTGLLDALSVPQLKAALAHEIAHIARSRRPVLVAVYLLRIVMFFNPVVLVAFRRAAQEDEKICDGMAADMTGEPRVLADTLKALYDVPDAVAPPEPASSRYLARMERYSHALEIRSRIERLEAESEPAARGAWAVLGLALAVSGAIAWFVV